MMRVLATREGLVGHTTATGHVIQRDDWFCALPSTRALRRIVRLWVSADDAGYLTVPVLDVGPWNEHDDAYVFNGACPQAESGTDTRGRSTNNAGIDLSDLVWTTLGFTVEQGPQWVRWELVNYAEPRF